MRVVSPTEAEIDDLRRRHGRFHERKFNFSERSDRSKPFPKKKDHIRAWVILVPVDIYRQAILVRKVGDPDWFFPGGGVEPGETVEQAAERELMEETGLEAEASSIKALWWWTVDHADGPATMAHFVFLQTVVGEAEVRDKAEIAEVKAFRDPPKEGAYSGLVHDALADSGMLHQWGIDYEVEQKFGTG